MSNIDDREPAKKIKVAKWLVKGEFDGREKDSDDILDDAGQILDDCCSHDILGQNVFQSTDGKFWQVQVQARIVQLTREEAEQIVQDDM